MSNVIRARFLRCSVIALYALAMVLVGAVRHDGVPEAEAMPSVAYALPGVEAAFICAHGGSGQRDHGRPADGSCCDACLIAHAPGLGSVAVADIAHPPISPRTYALASMSASIEERRVEPVSRGPPLA